MRLASRGLPAGWRKPWLALVVLTVIVLVQPNLLLPLAGLAARAGADLPNWMASDSLAAATPVLFGFAVAATLLLGVAAWLAVRTFRHGFFRDLPLFRLLANSGPDGDLTRYPRLSRGRAVDRAGVLSRNVVAEWYRRRRELPGFILTGTDLTVSRECLFTLVRPETHALLLRREWMAVQFHSGSQGAKEYRSEQGALFALPETFLQAVVASFAVPGAFPTQRIGIYRPEASEVAHHHFVDGGVLNNSPIHIAVDAGATHVISLETQPFSKDGASRGRGLQPGGVRTAGSRAIDVHDRVRTRHRRGRPTHSFMESLPGFQTPQPRTGPQEGREGPSGTPYRAALPRCAERAHGRHR